MKTLATVVKERPEYASLIRAVVSRIGKDSIMGVVSRGASGGFSGFIYHSETNAFFAKHKTEIMNLLKEMGDDLGEDPLVMVTHFNIFKDDKLSTTEVAESIYGNTGELNVQIRNAMAWFALEEVCRMFDE